MSNPILGSHLPGRISLDSVKLMKNKLILTFQFGKLGKSLFFLRFQRGRRNHPLSFRLEISSDQAVRRRLDRLQETNNRPWPLKSKLKFNELLQSYSSFPSQNFSRTQSGFPFFLGEAEKFFGSLRERMVLNSFAARMIPDIEFLGNQHSQQWLPLPRLVSGR